MPVIPFTFDKGLNVREDPILLKDGQLAVCQGFSYKHQGIMEARPAISAVNTTGLGSIHSLHRYINWVLCGAGSYLYYKWDLNGFCNRYIPPNGDFTLLCGMQNARRLRIADSDLFSFVINGTDRKAFTNTNVYDWAIPNPSVAPVGVAGAAGNPSDTYSLYYTWYILFPNGYAYETGPSPAGSVTVTSQKITWGGIAPCPYSGTGLINYRKLYRYSTALAETYYVDTIADNTTTTYTDNVSDTTLQTQVALTTTDYLPVPEGITDICEHLGRIWAIKDEKIIWSESYIPFAFPGANSIQVGIKGEGLTSVKSWQEQLFVASKRTWYRITGTDNTNFAAKKTFAEVGVTNTHTARKTRFGIVGKWHDGVYLFNGSTSVNLTNQNIGPEYFTEINWQTDFGADWDGKKYSLLIPSLQTSEQDLYSKLLLHFDGTDTGTAFTDSSLGNNTVYAEGNAQLDTAQKKFGSASLLLDGTGDDVYVNVTNTDFSMEKDVFTIDFWIRLNALPSAGGEYGLFGFWPDFNNYKYVGCDIQGSNQLRFYISDGSIVINLHPTWVPSVATWYHIAVIRGWGGNSDTFALCVDGAALSTGSAAASKKWPSGMAFFYIGQQGGNVSFNGWIDEFRVSKGIARWTSTFTPPVAAYGNSYVASAALPENILAVDFSTYPALRFFNDNVNMYASEFNQETGIRYMGHKDGFQYDETGAETISATLQTGDRGGDSVLQLKQLEHLYYELDTNGTDLTVTIYVDGVAQTTTITLNTSSRTRGRKELPAFKGYRFSIKLTSANAQNVKIYEPWGLSYSPAGE